ncbi:MAG: hypothetical protein ACLGI3_01840 [Actinomycetes bacterium]
MQPAPAEDELARSRPPVTDEAAPAAGRCPVAHEPAPPAACPAGHGAAEAAGCPVRTGAASRSKADHVVRKLLRIRDRPAAPSGSAYGSFQRSMLISAVRCTLTYVIFPFVAPAVGFATGVGPVVGILIGSFAIVCDVYTIRRFFAVDHRWRWQVSSIAFAVICLLSVLLVQDVSHLMR